MKMSDDPISKVYCVGNSKAIIRARWDNLYTFELEYPRFIHSEFMTHRCLTADTVLTFDLPSGSRGSKHRSYQITLGDFGISGKTVVPLMLLDGAEYGDMT